MKIITKPELTALKAKLSHVEALDAELSKVRQDYGKSLERADSISRSVVTDSGQRLKFDAQGNYISGRDYTKAIKVIESRYSPGTRAHNEAAELVELFERIKQLARVMIPRGAELQRAEEALKQDANSLCGAIESHFLGLRSDMLREIQSKLLPYCRDQKEAAEAADICWKPRELFLRSRTYRADNPRAAAKIAIAFAESDENN